jgi:hypothetical protein
VLNILTIYIYIGHADTVKFFYKNIKNNEF